MSLRRIINFVFLAAILAPSARTYADNPSINTRPRSDMMGGSGLALPGSKDSASLNPAGLEDIEEAEWAIPFVIELPFDVDVLDSALNYIDKTDGDNKTEAQESLEQFLRDGASSSVRARLNFNPSYTRKRLHIGPFVEALVDTDFRLAGLGGNLLAEGGDTAVTAGLQVATSYSFFEERLQVGVVVKPLYRLSPFVNRQQTLYDIAVGQNAGEEVDDRLIGSSQKSFGLGVDLGAKYNFETYGLADSHWLARFIKHFKPAVGLTYQDVADTRFFSGDALPADISQSLSLGLAVTPRWRFVQVNGALDFRNLNEKQSFLNTLHAGAEAILWDFWSIRFGLGQGYFSGGMGLDIPFFELDLYVAAQEAGEFAHINDSRVVGIRLASAF